VRQIPLEYAKWIGKYREKVGATAGKCREAAIGMNAVFPELVPDRGMVLAADGMMYMHWWLVGPFGEIVDPTEDQFGRIVSYPT